MYLNNGSTIVYAKKGDELVFFRVYEKGWEHLANESFEILMNDSLYNEVQIMSTEFFAAILDEK